jgi:hypothetical protein
MIQLQGAYRLSDVRKKNNMSCIAVSSCAVSNISSAHLPRLGVQRMQDIHTQLQPNGVGHILFEEQRILLAGGVRGVKK